MSCEINFQVLNHLPVCKVRPSAAVQLTVLPLLIRKLYRQLVPGVWLSETISMSLLFEQCGYTFSVGRPVPTPVSETAVQQNVLLQGTTINCFSCTMLAQKQTNIIHTLVCVRSDQINVYLLGLLLKCKLDSRNKKEQKEQLFVPISLEYITGLGQLQQCFESSCGGLFQRSGFLQQIQRICVVSIQTLPSLLPIIRNEYSTQVTPNTQTDNA